MAINFPAGVGPGTVYTDPTSGNNYVYEVGDYWRFLPELSAQGITGTSGGVRGRQGLQGDRGPDDIQGPQGPQGFTGFQGAEPAPEGPWTGG